jgi:hypothetical protein
LEGGEIATQGLPLPFHFIQGQNDKKDGHNAKKAQ